MLKVFSIRYKLAMMVILPLGTLTGLASVLVQNSLSSLAQVDETVRLTSVTAQVGSLVHELQKERGMSAGFLGSRGSQYAATLPVQRRTTNGELERYRDALARAGKLEARFQTVLNEADTLLAQLADVRTKVTGLAIAPAESSTYYTTTIARFLEIATVLAAGSSDPELVLDGASLVSFLRLKELTGQERATVNELLTSPTRNQRLFLRFVGLRGGQDALRVEFETFLKPEDRVVFEGILSFDGQKTLEEYRQTLLSTPEGQSYKIAPTDWFRTISGLIDAMKVVQDRLIDHIHGEITAIRQRSQTALAVLTAALSLTLVATLVVVILVSLDFPQIPRHLIDSGV